MVEYQRGIAPCGITGRSGGDIGSFRFQAENRPDRTECFRIGFESCRSAFFFRYGGPVQKSGVGAGKRHQGKTFIRSERVSGMYDGRAGNLRPVRFGSTGIETDRNGTVQQQLENRGGYILFAGRRVFGLDICFFPKKRSERKKAVIYCMVRNRQGSHGREKVLYGKVAGKRSRTGKRSRIAGCRPGGIWLRSGMTSVLPVRTG